MNTLSDLLLTTLALKWSGSKSELGAVANARACLEILGPSSPIKKLSGKSAQQIIFALRKQGNSNGTINRKLAALSTMITVAVESGLLKERITIARLKEAEPRARVFTEEEEGEIIGHMTDHPGRAGHFVTLLFDTGLRVSEGLELRWQNVGPTSLLIRNTKGAKARTVPLPSRSREMLAAMPRLLGYGPFDGLQQKHFQYLWDKTRNRMGFALDNEFIPHTIRHTYGTRLASRGIPLVTVKALMGHTSIKTTERYAHVQQADLERAIQVLE